jgi:UDP-glucose:(heptosyl)LPS alpha-1,3-glucosyltransferase
LVPGQHLLRIGLVYRNFNLGGSLHRFHVELARNLAAKGHDVHVYSIGATRDTSLAPGCTFHDLPVTTTRPGEFPARELLSFAVKAAHAVRLESFDVVHTRLPSTWIGDIIHLSGVARGERTRAGVSALRGLASNGRHPGQLVRVALERKAVRSRQVIRYHVDSSQVLADLVRYHHVNPARVTIVPPGVNLDDFKPRARKEELRQELGLPHAVTLLLFCGHDFHRKGLDRAIAALARMSHPAHLIVVGGRGAEDDREYERLAASVGVAGRVHFVGPRQDAHRFFQAVDVFVLPTRVDMWGTTVVEAMATALPAIVTDVAGSADVVDDGESGYVLPTPFDAALLSSILDQLSDCPDLRRRIGESARERVRGLEWKSHAGVVENEMLAIARRSPSSGRRR